MKIFCAFLLVLAVLGATAKPQQNISFQYHNLNSCSKNNGPYRSLPVIKTHIQTSVVENPIVNFPSYIPPTTISDSCHCLKTFVRPQIRNEIITVPTVDRIVRTITTPVVENINCDGNTHLATFVQTSNILPQATGARSLSETIQNNILSTSNENNNKFFNDGNTGRAFATAQNTNSRNRVAPTANGVNVNTIPTRPSIFTFPNSVAGTFQGYSNAFSGNSNIANGQRMNGF